MCWWRSWSRPASRTPPATAGAVAAGAAALSPRATAGRDQHWTGQDPKKRWTRGDRVWRCAPDPAVCSRLGGVVYYRLAIRHRWDDRPGLLNTEEAEGRGGPRSRRVVSTDEAARAIVGLIGHGLPERSAREPLRWMGRLVSPDFHGRAQTLSEVLRGSRSASLLKWWKVERTPLWGSPTDAAPISGRYESRLAASMRGPVDVGARSGAIALALDER